MLSETLKVSFPSPHRVAFKLTYLAVSLPFIL